MEVKEIIPAKSTLNISFEYLIFHNFGIYLIFKSFKRLFLTAKVICKYAYM